MDKELIQKLISSNLFAIDKLGVSEKMCEIIEEWIADEIAKLVEKTNQIKNETTRIQSITVLFAKRYKKLQLIVVVFEKHQLIDNTELLRDLLDII